MVDAIVFRLSENEILEKKYNDHKLKGNFKGCRECHIKPDLLLVYKKQDDTKWNCGKNGYETIKFG